MNISFWSPETRRKSERRTGRAVLLALIDVILVLASRRRFDALAFDEVKLKKKRVSALSVRIKVSRGSDWPRYDTYPEESVVLLPQVNITIGALRRTGKRIRYDQGGKGRAGKKEGHTTSLKCETQKTASLMSAVLFKFTATSVMAYCSYWDGGGTGSVKTWGRKVTCCGR